MTESEKEKREILKAKLAAKERLHKFLETKLIWINRSLLFIWIVVIALEAVNAINNISFIMDSELIRVCFVGLVVAVPAVFIAEGIGIYRKWGVSVNLEEAEGIIKGKDKNANK